MVRTRNLLLIICFLIPGGLLAQTFNILDYGALPDGNTLNTQAIQQAIDEAHEAGGGQVLIPGGTFLCGTIRLKSNVELHLSKKAVLLGSTNPGDYIRLRRWMAMVMADSAHHIAITGKGVLDGQGAELALNIDSLFYIGKLDSANYELPEKRPKAPVRPQIIEFVHCKDARVTGVTIKNAASWVQSYDKCERLILDDLKVLSDVYWNNDGMDVTDCKNVRITNCYLNTSDDGICLKSYHRDGKYLCDSIYIANCIVRSSASAVKFGTASYGGFRNIEIRNIKVYDTFRSAIAIEMVDGGILENVLVDGIQAKNTGNAIFIRLGRKFKKKPAGILRNVTIRNVKCEVPFRRMDYAYNMRGPALPYFHNIFPSSITGIPGHPVENVRLENIEITYPGRGNKAYAHVSLSRLDAIPEQIGHYPEFSMFGELPAWGFYARHVVGLEMHNITLRAKSPDYRVPMIFDDVNGLEIQGLEIKGDGKPNPIYLKDVENQSIQK